MLIRNKEAIFENQKWVVGSSSNIKVFKDEWVPGLGYPPLPPNTACRSGISENSRVEDLTVVMNGRISWNEHLINSLCDRATANIILQIPLGGIEIRCWGSSPAGTCTVKSLDHHISHPTIGPHLPWKKL